MKKFEFDEKNIKKVDIDSVSPNTWNPKQPNTKEYENVKRSLEINGYAQPILVREKDGGYEIIDGQHRYLAAKELGYQKIYIYDVGEISDEDAKAMTIWMQTQVPFDEIQLAPLVVELNQTAIELPYTDNEIKVFAEMLDFDYNTKYDEAEPKEHGDDGLKTLKLRMTPEQYEVVNSAIKYIAKEENVSDGRALELLCANGMTGYPFDTTAEYQE